MQVIRKAFYSVCQRQMVWDYTNHADTDAHPLPNTQYHSVLCEQHFAVSQLLYKGFIVESQCPWIKRVIVTVHFPK